MKITNLWSFESLPNRYIIEKLNGELCMFNITPFREIKESDLIPYKGHNPSMHRRSVEVANYVLKLYGLTK